MPIRDREHCPMDKFERDAFAFVESKLAQGCPECRASVTLVSHLDRREKGEDVAPWEIRCQQCRWTCEAASVEWAVDSIQDTLLQKEEEDEK